MEITKIAMKGNERKKKIIKERERERESEMDINDVIYTQKKQI